MSIADDDDSLEWLALALDLAPVLEQLERERQDVLSLREETDSLVRSLVGAIDDG